MSFASGEQLIEVMNTIVFKSLMLKTVNMVEKG